MEKKALCLNEVSFKAFPFLSCSIGNLQGDVVRSPLLLTFSLARQEKWSGCRASHPDLQIVFEPQQAQIQRHQIPALRE